MLDRLPKPLRTTVYVGILVVSGVLIYLFAYRQMQFFRIPSRSMEPTLLVGDYIVTLREPAYKTGDVVVARDPEMPGGYIVKRLIAEGGDKVRVGNGALFVNGVFTSEPYVKEPMNYSMAAYEVPANEVVLLGDNRNNSDDSHSWPERCIPVTSIVGRVQYIYLPFGRAGAVRPFPPIVARSKERQSPAHPHGPVSPIFGYVL